MKNVYTRKPFYYETDQMGIINHTHFIKWMEESRIAFLEKIGVPLWLLEERGIVSPVLSLNCEYKNMVRFKDELSISIDVEKYNGIKLYLSYKIENKETGVIHATCNSSHCFLDKNNNIISLKKMEPEFHEKFLAEVI